MRRIPRLTRPVSLCRAAAARPTSLRNYSAGSAVLKAKAVPEDRTKLISIASRLKEGRALSLDVWTIFNAANLPPDCINLGQGYMNFAPPQWARDAAEEALKSVEGNHYAPTRGRPRLRRAIKNHYGMQLGKELDPDSEILVTSGANEGQYAALTAFIEPGDEVIMFEPFFELYLPTIVFHGGKPVYVPLHPTSDPTEPNKRTWKLDFDELRRAITPRTKLLMLNSPHNPLGKVFNREEMEGLADIAEEFNLLVMSDEVYEALVYDGKEYIRFASLPGMWDRTITVGSAGKMFAATGWRVGWLVGPPALIEPTLAATTRIVFCSNTPMQEAAAAGLEQARERRFFETQLQEYAERRDVLTRAFDELGMAYTHPEGSYFIMLDVSKVTWPENYPFPAVMEGRGRNFQAVWFMAMELGVSSVPVTDFYCDEHRSIGEGYARFSFCKDVDTLKTAAKRLQNLRKYLAP